MSVRRREITVALLCWEDEGAGVCLSSTSCLAALQIARSKPLLLPSCRWMLSTKNTCECLMMTMMANGVIVVNLSCCVSSIIIRGGIFTDADAFIQQSLPDMTTRDSSGAVEILEVADEEDEGREALVEAADDTAGASSAGGEAVEACTTGTEDAVETFK